MTEIDLPSTGQARALTDRIKVAVEGTWLLIQEAYVSRAWHVLGYPSWDAYVDAEFRTARLALPKEERAETIQSLRAAGMSLRAIATATDLGLGTVHRELSASTVPDGTVPDRVMSLDGRERPATPPSPTPAPAALPAPRRRPLPDAFDDAARDLARAADRLTRIAADDRFARNRETTHHQVPELLGALDHTARLLQAMRLEEAGASTEARRWWATSLHTISDALRGVAHSLDKEN